MAMSDPSAASRRLVSAARAERTRLIRDLDRLEREISQLRHALTEREHSAIAIRERLALLAPLAHDEDDSPFARRDFAEADAGRVETRATQAGNELRGVAIRIAAVRVLATAEDPSKPVHYRDWYRRVTAAGYVVAGRDPLASFLTQINRSPVVERAGGKGVYALNFEAVRLLRDQLRRLHHELITLSERSEPSDDAISRRAELMAKVARVERALREALASLTRDRDSERLAS